MVTISLRYAVESTIGEARSVEVKEASASFALDDVSSSGINSLFASMRSSVEAGRINPIDSKPITATEVAKALKTVHRRGKL